MNPQQRSDVGQALGRLPTGLFILSTKDGSKPLGFVASFVMQVGIQPPVVCAAVKRERDHLKAIRASERFALSILDAQSSLVMKHFFREPAEGRTPFDEIETQPAPSGCLVLPDSLAWLDCRLSGEHDSGDHVVVFGEVTAGRRIRNAEPSVRLREDGLGY